MRGKAPNGSRRLHSQTGMRRDSGRCGGTPIPHCRGTTIATRKSPFENPHVLFSRPAARSFDEVSRFRILNGLFTGKRLNGLELSSISCGNLLVGLSTLLVDVSGQ